MRLGVAGRQPGPRRARAALPHALEQGKLAIATVHNDKGSDKYAIDDPEKYVSTSTGQDGKPGTVIHGRLDDGSKTERERETGLLSKLWDTVQYNYRTSRHQRDMLRKYVRMRRRFDYNQVHFLHADVI